MYFFFFCSDTEIQKRLLKLKMKLVVWNLINTSIILSLLKGNARVTLPIIVASLVILTLLPSDESVVTSTAAGRTEVEAVAVKNTNQTHSNIPNVDSMFEYIPSARITHNRSRQSHIALRSAMIAEAEQSGFRH
jgi:hypothetical protein